MPRKKMKRTLLILILLLPILLDAQIAENFESLNISEWKQVPENRWAASETDALEGKISLKHIFDNSIADKDRISIPVENIDVSADTVAWRFVLRHGYNPTATNFWTAYIMSDKDAEMMMKDSTINAYAVGVNLNASNDLLCLYKITNGVASVLINTNINWETEIRTSGKAAIEITRKPSGEWSLRVDKTGSFENFEDAGTPTIDATHTTFNYFGLLYTYTASADMRIWFDKLTITSSALPAQIVSTEKISKTKLSVTLSKSIQSIGNISLTNENGETTNIISQNIEGQNSDKISLITETLFGRKFTITINNFVDTDGISATLTKTFLIDNFSFGDIVFNEIMFRSEPVVGLPNRKYIELYNRTPHTINIGEWKILYGTGTGESRISSDTISAYSYAIICVSTSVSDLSPYGKIISAVSFPTLTYSGQNLRLIDKENTLIAAVNYLPDWHTSDEKIAGGWSLEKIDVNNLSELKSNWKSSNDTDGGTPGRQNSVFAANPDNEPPILLNWEIVDNDKLLLTFNEPVNIQISSQNQIYFVDNNLGNPINVVADYNTVLLNFADTIVTGIVYKLTIQNIFADLAGNNLIDFSLIFGEMQKPQIGDIIINEVLFNPYPNGVDFVEIYNRSQKNIDLRNLFLATRNKSTGALQSIYQISNSGIFFEPQNFAVLTTDAEIIKQQYFVQNPDAFVVMERFPTYANSDATVVLLDDAQNVIDEFSYNEKMHFRFLSDVKGVSLERKSYDDATNDSKNWHSASSAVGYATPTYKNSQAEYESETYGFEISPQTFSPDNSGFDDKLYINYKMPESGYLANIKIYDSRGRWIADVQNNALLGIEGSFTWNGQNNKHQKSPAGVYIVYIQYFNLQGQVTLDKKACVIGVRK